MAGAALTVDLNARLVNFQKGMDQANKQLDRLQKNAQETNGTLKAMGKTATTLGKAFVGVFGVQQFAQLTSAAASWADSLDNAASRVGVTTDFLQALRVEAEKFGASAQTTDMALQRFSRRLEQAKTESGELYKILQRYGRTDIAFLDTNDALREYSKLLGESNDAGQRNLITMAGMDSEAATVGQTLADLNGEFDALIENQKALGQVVSERGLAGLDALNDGWDKLTNTIGARFNDAVGTTVYEFGRLWDRLRYGVDVLDDANAHVKEYEASLRQATETARNSTLDASGILPLLTEKQFDQAVSRVDAIYDKMTQRADAMQQRIDAIGRPDALGALTFGQELTSTNAFGALQQIRGTVQSGDLERAQQQIEAMAGGLEDLASASDNALDSLRVAELTKQLSAISQEAFKPQQSQEELTQSVITQLMDAQAYARENPLRWEVDLNVTQAVDDIVEETGFKQ